jgi:hypothetical protein
MLLLDLCPIPQAEFACISLLMDNSSISLEPFAELASVSSPLATTAPVIARSCLTELHEYLNVKLAKQSPLVENGHTGIDRNGDTNGALPLSGILKTDVEQHSSNEPSKTSDAQAIVNDNEHLPLSFPYSNDLSDLLHKLCIEEDKLHSIHTFHKKVDNRSRCDTYTSKNGLTLEYILLQDQTLVQKCLSSFLKLAKGSTTSLLSIHGIVIAIGVKGPVHQIPYCFATYEHKQRLAKFASTFSFSESFHTRDQKRDLELMLLSLIMDHDSLKTNEQFDAEYGNDYDFETDPFLDRKSNKPKLFPKKFSFKDKRRRRKQDLAEEDISKNVISTALVSSSAPSSEIARIVSDQMQALSLAESDMNIHGYSKMLKHSLGGKSDRVSILTKSPSRGTRRLARDLVGFEYSARPYQPFNPISYESPSINGKITHASDGTSVTAITMSTDSSVASSIPILSGPSRDSSINKKHFRRNKVISASLMNKQSNFEKGFDPFAVEETITGGGKDLGKLINSDLESTTASSIVDSVVSLGSPVERALPDAKVDIDPSLKTTPRAGYVPGSRKLFITLALNEDLSCAYVGNKLTHCAVQGIIQILMKSESTAFVPFLCQLFDSEMHIESIEHNEKYANNISHERVPGNEWAYQFIVTLPKADNYYPVLKYMCNKKVVPVPLVSLMCGRFKLMKLQ